MNKVINALATLRSSHSSAPNWTYFLFYKSNKNEHSPYKGFGLFGLRRQCCVVVIPVTLFGRGW